MIKTLGIIPARSGSSEVKGKNKRPLAGRPLVTYTINEALRSNFLDRVILSTDAEEIRNIGINAGVEAPFLRPSSIAANETLSMSVIMHCLLYLKNENYVPDAVLYLQPTSPFRTSKHIDESIELLSKNNVDSIISMAPVTEHPFFMYKIIDKTKPVGLIKLEKKPERRQDLPDYWIMNNNIALSTTKYIYNAEKNDIHFLNQQNFLPYFINGVSKIDINTEIDFQYAEFMMNIKGKEE